MFKLLVLLGLVAAVLALEVPCESEHGVVFEETVIDAEVRQMVWVSDDRNEIYVLSYLNTLYKSKDEGKTWASQMSNIPYSSEPQLPSNRTGVQSIIPTADQEKLYLLGYGHIMWTTVGDGTYKVYRSTDYVEYVHPHPTDSDKAIVSTYTPRCVDWTATGDCYRVIHLTTNFGLSWTKIADHVWSWDWGSDSSILYTAATAGGRSGLKLFITEPLSATISRQFSYTDFLYEDSVLYAVDSSNSSSLSLWVSLNLGVTFTKAVFASSAEGLDESRYTILDSSEGTSFINVQHNDPHWGHTYSAPFVTEIFTMNLPRTLRNSYTTDFFKVHGLDGIYIANHYQEYEPFTPANQINNYLRSVVSFDKGGIWTVLPAPTNVNCNEPDCSLHIFGNVDQYTYSSLYTTSNAVGLVIAIGNHGTYKKSHNEEVNTYFSRDAGETWQMIHEGAYIYEFGDHGGVVVLAKNEEPTNSILYTWNDGADWYECQFSDKSIQVTNIRVEPSFTSRKFILHGYTTNDHGAIVGVLILLDFTGLPIPNCKGYNTPGTADSDYEYWNPGPQSCLLGEKVQYVRRKQASECFNGDVEAYSTIGACACTREDYICDGDCWLETRNTEGPGTVCVNVCEGTELDPTIAPTECDGKYTITQGYQLVQGDMCSVSLPGAIDLLPTEHNCPSNGIGGFWTAVIVILCLLVVAAVIGLAGFLAFKNKDRLQELFGSLLNRDSSTTLNYSLLDNNKEPSNDLSEILDDSAFDP
eukprot:TRINITY_DN929_c0_g1_i1.p1 TRINITY_DN929_c0_g1~~TRINITY_DN929_c0_g1_i1.p1  ORF type:complete len:783 (+),score=372.96 TRINITY_DN929_c0_g1_i1:94-2349(+)